MATKLFLALGFALCIAQLSPAQEPRTGAALSRTGAELLRIVTDQFSAITRGDMAAYGSSMADDLIYIPDWGTAYSKPQILARTLRSFKEGVGKKFEDIRDVHVVEDTGSAIFTCEVTERVIYGDQEFRDRLRRTVHFVRRNGRWQAVLIQFTTVPENHHVAAQIDSPRLDAYVGRYLWTSGLVNTITREGDKLVSQWRATGSKTELLPLNETTFFSRDDLGETIFVKNDEGRVTHYIYRRADGQEFRAKRIE